MGKVAATNLSTTVYDATAVTLRVCASKLDRKIDMEVVCTATTGEEGVEMFRRFRPDIVLMDLQLPGMSGLRAIEEIRREDGDAHIIVLTMHQGDEDIYRALRAGAISYLCKDMLVNDLVPIVREVHNGDTQFRR